LISNSQPARLPRLPARVSTSVDQIGDAEDFGFFGKELKGIGFFGKEYIYIYLVNDG